nr:MAG TPA: hypothetical protein [Caudoviricetes sp.]
MVVTIGVTIRNHNHRPCRWFAQAPLGPITSRAYRLIELSSLAWGALLLLK